MGCGKQGFPVSEQSNYEITYTKGIYSILMK